MSYSVYYGLQEELSAAPAYTLTGVLLQGPQEQPPSAHPGSLEIAGLSGPNVRAPVVDRIMAEPQEQPTSLDRAPRFWWSQPTNPAVGAQQPSGSVVMAEPQETPRGTYHPPLLWPGVRPGNTAAAGIVGTVLVRQEIPPVAQGHVQPVLRPGLPPQQVKTSRGDYFHGRQEQPPQTPPMVLSGPFGQRLVPVATTSIMPGPQPRPDDHPSYEPEFWAGPQGPDVRVPVVDSVLARQEQPPQAPSLAAGGPVGQLVVPAVTRAVSTRQEQPDHPAPRLTAGPQGPSVRSPILDMVMGRQDLPDHPTPRLWPGVVPVNSAPPPILHGTRLIQWRDDTALPQQPMLAVGPSGQTVRVAVTDLVLTRQEQPPYQPSVAQPGPIGQLVVPPTVTSALARQEQPPQTPSLTGGGVQGPGVRPPTQDTVLTRQEQPPQTPSVLVPTPQTQSVLTKVADSVLARQEQPGHPAPQLAAGPQGPSVFVKVTDSVFVRQEAPDHPTSRLGASPQTQNVARAIGGIFVRQETPDHPLPRLAAGVQSTTLLPAPTRVVVARQEQPWHPAPYMYAGEAIRHNRKFVKGRTVVLTEDL